MYTDCGSDPLNKLSESAMSDHQVTLFRSVVGFRDETLPWLITPRVGETYWTTFVTRDGYILWADKIVPFL